MQLVRLDTVRLVKTVRHVSNRWFIIMYHYYINSINTFGNKQKSNYAHILQNNKIPNQIRDYSMFWSIIIIISYFGFDIIFLFQSVLHKRSYYVLQHKILNESRDVGQLVLLLIYNRVVYLVWLICHYLGCSMAFEYIHICYGILNESRDVRYISAIVV